MMHHNVRFLYISPRVAESLHPEDPGVVAGSWVRVPELVAALHVEAERDPVGAEALLAVANGLAVSVARLKTL